MAVQMSIEEYLKGLTGFEIPDSAIKTILLKRRIDAGTSADSLTEKELDLSTADLYMWCASTPSVKQSTEDADGDWKHVEGGWQTSAYDKREMRAMARELYDKWEDKKISGTITLINL